MENHATLIEVKGLKVNKTDIHYFKVTTFRINSTTKERTEKVDIVKGLSEKKAYEYLNTLQNTTELLGFEIQAKECKNYFYFSTDTEMVFVDFGYDYTKFGTNREEKLNAKYL